MTWSLVGGARLAGLSVSETDLLGFSQITIASVDREEKKLQCAAGLWAKMPRGCQRSEDGQTG